MSLNYIDAANVDVAWAGSLKPALKTSEGDFTIIQIRDPSGKSEFPKMARHKPVENLRFLDKRLRSPIHFFKRDSFKPNSPVKDFFVNLDPLENLIERYTQRGYGSNQCTLEIATPSDILSDAPPNLRCLDTRVRYGALHFIPYFSKLNLAELPRTISQLEHLKSNLSEKIGTKNGETILTATTTYLPEEFHAHAETLVWGIEPETIDGEMQTTLINATDLNNLWYLVVRNLIEKGHKYEVEDGSYKEETRSEFDFYVGIADFPSRKPLVPSPSMGVPAPADMHYVDGEYRDYLTTDVMPKDTHYTYGEQMIHPKVNHDGKRTPLYVNQLEVLLDKFSKGSTHETIEIGSPEAIFLKDPQCWRLMDIWIKDGTLFSSVYFRSWCAIGGMPSNLAGIQKYIKAPLASAFGLKDGPIYTSSKGIHIYSHHDEYAGASTGLNSQKIQELRDKPLPYKTD